MVYGPAMSAESGGFQESEEVFVERVRRTATQQEAMGPGPQFYNGTLVPGVLVVDHETGVETFVGCCTKPHLAALLDSSCHWDAGIAWEN